jgi:hypothetical protein
MTLVLDIAFAVAIGCIVAASVVLFVIWRNEPHQIAERALRQLLRRNRKR